MLESDEPGGAELFLLRLAEELRSRGHTVIPVGPARGTGWLGQKVRQAGFPWKTFHLARPIDPGCVWRLARLIRDHRVDVVHSHEFTMSVYGAAAAWLTGRPHIISMHGNEKMTAVWRRRAALRWAFQQSHEVIAVSEATRSSLESELGLRNAERIRVIRNGVPEVGGDRGAGRRRLGIGADELLIFTAGSVIPRKGHLILLRALDALRGTAVPKWRLVIAGWLVGDEPEKLRAFAAERGMTERLLLLGQRDDIPDLLAASDIFALPSLWEGLPLSMLEAMFAERPIVASRVAGVPEAVDSGVEGLLVPPGDVGALAEALGALLQDPELRARLGAAARARALRAFSIAAMTDAYLQLYRGEQTRVPVGSSLALGGASWPWL